MWLRLLLYMSGASLVLSGVLAGIYEGFAPLFGQPLISNIIIPWVKTHNLWASLIVGGVAGFLTFLVVHFFGARA